MVNASGLCRTGHKFSGSNPIFQNYSYLPAGSGFATESTGIGGMGASTPGNESLTGTFSNGIPDVSVTAFVESGTLVEVVSTAGAGIFEESSGLGVSRIRFGGTNVFGSATRGALLGGRVIIDGLFGVVDLRE